jgi:membrane protease YdiL (CAAX protease family)
MNHLESAFAGKNSFWRYIAMFGAVIIAVISISAIIGFVIRMTADTEMLSMLETNSTGISDLGLDKNIVLLFMLLPSIAGIFAFILFITPLNERTIYQTINGTGSIRWKRFFISALVWATISGLYLIVFLNVDPSNFTLNNKSVSLIYLTVISLLFIPFQAILEEVLFRGYLMQGLAAIIPNRLFPLLLSSVLFALLHAFNPEVKEFGLGTVMPQYLMFGLVFGVV